MKERHKADEGGVRLCLSFSHTAVSIYPIVNRRHSYGAKEHILQRTKLPFQISFSTQGGAGSSSRFPKYHNLKPHNNATKKMSTTLLPACLLSITSILCEGSFSTMGWLILECSSSTVHITNVSCQWINQ